MMINALDLRDRVSSGLLDVGISREVEVLNQYGVETYESCQGTDGHAYPEPTVAFYGDRAEGLRAYAVALWQGLRVLDLRRVWSVQEGDLVGPHWEMTFRTEYHPAELCPTCEGSGRASSENKRNGA